MLDEMLITLGPKATNSDRIVVETLVRRFAPGATIAESELRGAIV